MSPRERVERIEVETSGVAAQFGIDSWELQFLASVKGRATLSDKQEAMLAKIEQRVFGEGDDE